MQRLLYISTARRQMTPDDLDRLLATSRRNNARAGVTGLLVVGGKRFLQVLEGPDAAVETVFARIARDPRHFAVVQLSRNAITERAFGDWAMGYRAGGNVGVRGDLAAIVDTILEPIADPSLRGYFTGFAQLHAAA